MLVALKKFVFEQRCMSYLDHIDNRYLYGAIGILGGWGFADLLGGSELLGGAVGGGLGYYHGARSEPDTSTARTAMADVDQYLDGDHDHDPV